MNSTNASTIHVAHDANNNVSKADPMLRSMTFCAMLLSVAAADGATTDPQLPIVKTPIADQEPITAIPEAPPIDPQKLALGRTLFEDKTLSQDGTRACISCHDTHSNGTDERVHDVAANGAPRSFNTASVFNAALSFRLDWEGDFKTLEAQAEASLTNPKLMGTHANEALARVKEDPQLIREFSEVYGSAPNLTNLLDAIASYERTLVTPQSRFDRWLQGDTAAISIQEWHGYQLFKSFGCVSCHQGANVGGNLFEKDGVFHPLAPGKPEMLRVPSLRNVAVTPPYFHDGSVPTLGAAVRKMANAQLDLTPTDAQINAIVAFLQTLTGKYNNVPLTTRRP